MSVSRVDAGLRRRVFAQPRGGTHNLAEEGTSFVALLRACTKKKDLNRGIILHDRIVEKGLLEKYSDALVTMYAKCGALAQARELFDMYNSRDVLTWTALISGYSQKSRGQDALDYFEQMLCHHVSPNAVTFACILKACGSVGTIEKGQQIHDEIARQGLLRNDVVLGTALVDMYAKCRDFKRAEQVLQDLPSRDVGTWNALITGYTQQGHGEQALHCFEQMQFDDLCPNAVTFTCILKSCGSIGAVDKGEEIHDEITKLGFLRNNIILGNALIDMYVKCNALHKAHKVLDDLCVRDIVSWNALITGYAQRSQGNQALNCFGQMQCEGFTPGPVTFISILKACGSLRADDKGEQIHLEVARRGLLRDDVMLGTALVDMYVKCGALAKARQVLEELPARNAVSWNALIAGHAQQGQGEQALSCLDRMQNDSFFPDVVTLICILKACGSIGGADKGKTLHDEIARQGLLGNDMILGTALVDMYAKCGALSKAHQVFNEVRIRDAVTWNALIVGYAQQGQHEEALHFFQLMQHDGIQPNASTFSCVLTACCLLGLESAAAMHFSDMTKKHGMKPTLEHYTGMIDLFGRTGQLEKAVEATQYMSSSDSAVWSALLGACRKWGGVNVGRWAFDHALAVDKANTAAYFLMADIYAAAGMHEEAQKIEVMRKDNIGIKWAVE